MRSRIFSICLETTTTTQEHSSDLYPKNKINKFVNKIKPVVMKREKIQRLVLEYLSHAQYRSVDCTDYVIRHGKGTSGATNTHRKEAPDD